jgi:hypothetical protein
VHSIFVDSKHLYSFTGSTLVRYDLETGQVNELYTPTNSALVRSLSGDADRLYLTTPGCAKLISVPKAGGDPAVVEQPDSPFAGGALPVAAGASALYCGGGAGGPPASKLYRWQLNTHRIELFQDLGPADEYGYVPEVHSMVEVGDTLWLVKGRPSGHRGHELMRAPVAGGDAISVTVVNDSGAKHLIHDAARNALYWPWQTQKKLAKYSMATSELTTTPLEASPTGPLAADAEGLYWTTADALMRTNKF